MNNINITKEKKTLLSNFIYLMVLQAFTYVLPLITLPYLVKVLGEEKFGLLMFAQSFILFFSILVDYGFNLSATRNIAINKDSKEKIEEIFSSVMIIKIFLIGVCFLILTFIVFGFKRFSVNWELYYLTFLSTIGQAIFPVWYFQGIERMEFSTKINVVIKIAFTFLIFLFVHKESDYVYVSLLNGLGMIASGLISLWIVYYKFHQSFSMQRLSIIKKHFKDSSQFFISRISVSIYTSANAFILGIFTDNTMVGYYSIAEKLYMAIQFLYSPVSQALYPYVAKNENIKLFKKIFYSVFFLNTLVVIILYFLAAYVFGILFTQKVEVESILVFHIFLVANFIVVPSVLMGYPFLGALGYSEYANKSVINGSVIHILGLIILVLSNDINIYNVTSLVIITELVVLMQRIFWIKENKLWQRQ